MSEQIPQTGHRFGVKRAQMSSNRVGSHAFRLIELIFVHGKSLRSMGSEIVRRMSRKI
jgi:hypothetical protein